VKDGAPFAFGAHLVGLGQGALPLTPSCDLAIAPFSALYFPVTLDASGSAFTKFNLAKTVSGLDLTLQSAFLDLAAPDLVSATNALRLVMP
jgi:hypothetical protein